MRSRRWLAGRWSRAAAASAAVLALWGQVSAETGKNLLKDPGMEQRSNVWKRWGAKPADATPPVVSFSPERPYRGRYCLLVQDQWNNISPYGTQFFNLPRRERPDQVLELTFHARADRPQAFRAGMLFNRRTPDKPLEYTAKQDRVFQATSNWQSYSMIFPSAPKDANVLNLLLIPTSGGTHAETGSVYFDDFSVHWRDVAPAELLGIDRQAINQVNYPRTPANGAVVTVNPPAFVWLPPTDWKKGKYTYTLEYARTPDFRDAVRYTGLFCHLKVPEHTFAAGKWYWRVGVENQPSGTVWTKTWSFTVTEEVVKDPYPGASAALAKVPLGHPRLYVTPDTSGEFRRRGTTGDLKPCADWIRDSAAKNRYIGAKLVPEPPFLPDRRKDRKRFSEAYIHIMNTTRPDESRMERMAQGYMLTGDKMFGEEAKRRILHFFSWDPDGSTALKNNDEPAMWIMRWGLIAYDWTYDLYTKEEHQIIEDSISRRAEQLYDYLTTRPFDSNPYDSHPNGYLQILGDAALVLAHERPEQAQRWFQYSTECFRAICPIYGTPDGGWNEGVAYWSFSNNHQYIAYVIRMRTATGMDLGKSKPYFRNCGYYPLYGWPTGTQLPSFGDSECPTLSVALTSAVAAVYSGNPDFLAPIKRSDVAVPGPKVAPNTPWMIRNWAELGEPRLDRLPPFRFFPGIGFVVMRNDLEHYENDVGLFFECSPFGNSCHRHNAQNCFMLEAYTEPLLLSSGYYDYYSSEHHRNWTWETKSHCGLTYDDGHGQIRGGLAAGSITEFRHDEDFDVATGDASKAYPDLKSVKRTIVHVRPGLYIVRDRVESATPHVWEFNLHTIQPGSFDEAGQIMMIELPKAGLEVKFFAPQPLKFGTFSNPYLAAYYDKRKVPERWHFRASWPKAECEMELVTVLMPYRTGEKAQLPQVEKLPDGICLKHPDGSVRTVRFNGDQVLLERN